MDKYETIRRAEIAMAWARGEAVQWRDAGSDNQWVTEKGPNPQFFYSGMEWRIKPKPLECWAWKYDDTTDYCGAVVECGSNPPRKTYTDNRPGRWVRMREVDE